MSNQTIRAAIHQSLDQYLQDLNGETCGSLYRLTINEAEAAVIHYVLTRHNFSQTRSAKMLGITRNTLKKKMLKHGIKPPPANE